MSDPQTCKKIRKMLISQCKKAFGVDFEAYLQQRSQELWIIGIDANQRRYVDVCGTVGSKNIEAMAAKGFHNTDAGYKVNAQGVLGLSGVSVDVFLLNIDHFNANPDDIEPIIVHELAHMLEESGHMPQPEFNDHANADAILKAYHPDAFRPAYRHNTNWALHLAAGARTILKKGHSGHRTIRSYLEKAVPASDREDGIKATKGWN